MFKSRKQITRTTRLKEFMIDINYFYQVDVKLVKLTDPSRVEVLNVLYLIAFFKCVLGTPSNVRFREELSRQYSIANSILDLENIPPGCNAYSSYETFKDYVNGRPAIIERYNQIILTNNEIHYNGECIKHDHVIGKCTPPDQVDQIFVADAFRENKVEFDHMHMHTGKI